MLLADFSALGVDGDHRETHLEGPAVHDVLQWDGQTHTVVIHRLMEEIYLYFVSMTSL